MKILLMILIAALASSASFVVHVFTVEWLPSWIGSQMDGIAIQASWDVRYIAIFTSIEYGLAASAIYWLAREKLLFLGNFKSSLILAILLASVHGAFIRQPLMDFVVGNPLHVVVVQNIFKWLVWMLMSFVIVYGVEYIIMRKSGFKTN